MGPQNAVMGEENFGMNLPVMQAPQDNLDGERRMAKFSKTKEYKVLKDFMNGRIEYYQQFLPGGNDLKSLSAEERGNMWLVADSIISEFRAMMAAYEQAAEVVKKADV